MAVRPLDPQAWGFTTRCFVCEPTNPSGLRIPFAFDEETRKVSAEFTFGQEYSGAPQFIHGGVVMAVLDDALAWVAIATAGRFAVVRESSTKFERGVRVGEPHRVEAELTRDGSIRLEASGQVFDAAGRRCARTSAKLVVLSEQSARSAIGEVAGADSAYLRAQKESS